jgi:hypothetical protein
VIEEVPSEELMTNVTRRLLQFLKSGVEEYWVIDEVNKRIWIYCYGSSDCKRPADFDQIVADFFALPK